jgi:AsmA protein
MECKELWKKELKVDRIKSGIKAEKGIFSLKPLTIDIFGGKGEGDVAADKTEAGAEYKINLNVSKLDFEKLQESFGIKRLTSGRGDLTVSLTVKEKEGRSLIKGMDGTLSLRGNNLITHTVDLDKVLSAYETSQKFDLVDIGAFFIAGPLGTVALRGYRYGNVYYQTLGGRGAITQFVSHWKIKDGEADATDCALATLHNRVALKGKLNLTSERYDNVTVAILDDKGCPRFMQTITGPFDSPRVGVVRAVESLAGPILNLYREAKRFVQAGKCEVFYNGSVKQPR